MRSSRLSASNRAEICGKFLATLHVSDKIGRSCAGLAGRREVLELFARMASRVEIVVTFLALLDLSLKQVRATQSALRRERDRAGGMTSWRGAGAVCGYVGDAAANSFHKEGWNEAGRRRLTRL